MKPASASCGLTFNCAEDLTAKLRVMTLAGYDFLVTPIIHPRYRLPEQMDQPSGMTNDSSGKPLGPDDRGQPKSSGVGVFM